MNAMNAYELRVDEDIDSPVVVWRGSRKPTQAQIDSAASSACARGWNGVRLDLYEDGEWRESVRPSESVLA